MIAPGTFRHIGRVADNFPHGSIERSVALYHDHLEDNLGPVPDELLRHVLVLTRIANEPYTDYIDRIINSGDTVAIRVKIADLTDNLERCHGEHGGTAKPLLATRYHAALARLVALTCNP